MKKIFILVLVLFTATGCFNNKVKTEDHLIGIIKDEMHNFVMDHSSGGFSDRFNNDAATTILLLQTNIGIDLEMILDRAGTSLDIVTETYENMEIDSINTAFNMILAYNLLDLELTELTAYFEDLKKSEIIFWDYLTTINCLSMLGVNSKLKSELLELYSDIDDQGYMDADLAALIVVSHQGNAPKEYLEYLYSKITNDGVAGYSGEMSCTSTAQVIIALMSEGIVYKNNGLNDILLNFKVTDGFSEFLEGEVDYAFASPKAFCALATIYLFEETSNKVLFY